MRGEGSRWTGSVAAARPRSGAGVKEVTDVDCGDDQFSKTGLSIGLDLGNDGSGPCTSGAAVLRYLDGARLTLAAKASGIGGIAGTGTVSTSPLAAFLTDRYLENRVSGTVVVAIFMVAWYTACHATSETWELQSVLDRFNA